MSFLFCIVSDLLYLCRMNDNIMRKLYTVIMIGTMATTLLSCAEKKKNPNIIIAKKAEKQAPKQVQHMSEYTDTRQANWVGSVYTVEVKRISDTSLPVVEQEDHTKYYDNKISVRVTRKDGSVFFSKDFTKKDFAAYIDQHTQEHGALLGVVFAKAEGDYLFFGGSVGSPDIASDEYVPLVVKISRMGNVSITQDTIMDVEDNEKVSPDNTDETI